MALPPQFRDLCRACMKRRDDMKMFFFSKINSVNVASMLTKIALLPVEPSDSLPKVLCNSCIKRLNDAYNFQQMCIKSHIRFNDMLHTKQWPHDVVIKKEPCEFTISSVESQAKFESNKNNKKLLNLPLNKLKGILLKEPKIEPDIAENTQSDTLKKEKSSKGSNKTKKFTCNICQDLFETWSELTIHIADHKMKSTATVVGDDNSCEPKSKKRAISEVSNSKDAYPSEASVRVENYGSESRSENSSSIDGLPLEPICNVQVKEEIESDHNSSEYDEDDHQEPTDKESHKSIDENEQEICQKSVKTERKSSGRNFTNSRSPVCEMCGFKPKIPALMHAHVRNRHPDNYMEYVENWKACGEWVVKCRICDVYLFSSTVYGQHLKYTHSQIVNDCSGYFECNHCDQTFSSKNDFFLHKNQAHNMRRINKAKQLFICLLCDKQFGRYINLQQHEETHESDGTAGVAVSAKSISAAVNSENSDNAGVSSSSLSRKRRAETPVEVLEAAAKTSPKKVNTTTSAGRKYQCHGCDKSFATEFGLRVHIGCVHKGMEKLPPKKSITVIPVMKKPPLPPSPPVTDSYCEICEKQFDSIEDCGSHMQKHYEVAHTYKERKIRCKECKYESTTRSDFKHHIKSKHKEIYRKRIAGLATMDPKFEACILCFMPVFYTKIIRHINAHYMREDERRYESDELSSPPSTKSPNKFVKIVPKDEVDSPKKMNENGKIVKLKCKHCSTFYPDKSSLMKHMMIFHKKTEKKKHFNCKICFRSITGLQNFNSHMNAHKREFPNAKPKLNHACHLCSGVFGEQEDLQKHLVVAHSFNPMIFYKK